MYPDDDDDQDDEGEYQQPTTAFTAIDVCIDPEANGHTDTSRLPFGSERKGPMTDEQKAERWEVIENNKAWEGQRPRAGSGWRPSPLARPASSSAKVNSVARLGV